MEKFMSKLEALKAAFAAKTTGTSSNADWKKFYPFWKMADDSIAIVRFLPDLDEDNPMGFLVEHKTHELIVNGEKKIVPCLSMYGESCPCCEVSRKYYDEKDETLGKRYYRKLSYLGQVIVVESPIDHDTTQLVKLIELGPKIFKLIQAAFQSGDLEVEPYALKGGYNFRIKKAKNGQYSNYDISSFSPKQTDIEDDVIEQLELYNLADHRTKYITRAEMEALLLADQTGASVPTATPSATQSKVAPASTMKPAMPDAVEQQETVAEAPEAPVAATGKNNVLEALRAKAKAKAAADAGE
jgi:hypothetical protein